VRLQKIVNQKQSKCTSNSAMHNGSVLEFDRDGLIAELHQEPGRARKKQHNTKVTTPSKRKSKDRKMNPPKTSKQ
jgi:hypothetical protein